MTLWQKVCAGLSFLVALLSGAYFLEKKRRENAESALENSEVKLQDAVLQEKMNSNRQKFEEERAKLEAEKGRKLSPEEMKKFLENL